MQQILLRGATQQKMLHLATEVMCDLSYLWLIAPQPTGLRCNEPQILAPRSDLG